MLKKSKKYLITTKTHEIYIVRNTCPIFREYCPKCQMGVEMLNLDSAVTVSGKRFGEILVLIENGKTHSIETSDGHLFLCRNSLLEN